MSYISKLFESLKKYRFTVIAILAVVVTISCIFVFAGNNSDDNSSSSAEVSEKTEVSEKRSGEGIYVDGNFIAALSSAESANKAVDAALAERVAALGIDTSLENSFNNDVKIVSGKYPVASFVGSDKAASLLSGDVKTYKGETLSVELSVKSVQTLSDTVVIEYQSKKIFTDGLRDGVEKVVSKGYNGEGTETYQIVSINGVVTERNVVSFEVISDASDEIVRVGTCSDGIKTATLGTFTKPYDGIITSYMGPRWGRTHKGIDIAQHGSCYGDPAVAAADGVVVLSEWHGGYGNCVVIDHGDGVHTLYAHFSERSVEVGDVVSAGDEVGKIGSTGNSTGPHLHFEVYVDGEAVNPLIFVDYQ